MRHSARVLCNPRSGRVFTTINTPREVICFLRVRSNPLHTCDFVLQIFEGANFLVAKKHQHDSAELWVGNKLSFQRQV